MARDFEDVFDLDDLSDDELRALVRDRLASHNGIDERDINVDVEDGVVRLDGRVGTEAERRIAAQIVSDEIGVEQVENDLVIDPIRRAQNPEATDEELVVEDRTEGLLLGDRPLPLTRTSEVAPPESTSIEDEENTQGTTDVQDTIRFGVPWIPPERPTGDGLPGEQAGVEDMGEDH